jgi:hypothetical protein
MAHPGVKMNCPLCGARLAYLRVDGDTHVYHCLRHGAPILPPDGHLREQP